MGCSGVDPFGQESAAPSAFESVVPRFVPGFAPGFVPGFAGLARFGSTLLENCGGGGAIAAGDEEGAGTAIGGFAPIVGAALGLADPGATRAPALAEVLAGTSGAGWRISTTLPVPISTGRRFCSSRSWPRTI